MAETHSPRPSWNDVLRRESPLILPAVHDSLTARLVERAGFHAFQVGGFALIGARHGLPDIDLVLFGEQRAGVRDILEACNLPVLVDADDGYGDVKNVTRTVRDYERMGVSAIFMEDQHAPKRCGHMAGKKVVPADEMESKIRAAVSARRSAETFLVARTDAIAPLGVDEALRRGERYLKAGADGVYVEGPTTREELEQIGRAFRGVPLATSVLERGGVTPWLPPEEFGALGFSMILYPASVIFRVAHAIQRGLSDLRAGRPLPPDDSVDFDEFESIVGKPDWADIEHRFGSEEPS